MEWAQYLTRGVPPTKRLLIGGNWYVKYDTKF